jgi:NAD(P)-dependent dehydrogenase (short-subunit alcohol dehydrogenase family)
MSTTKTALITGANKGIGLETARQLAQQGVSVIIGSRNPDNGERAAEQLRDEGLQAHSVVLDVGDPISIQTAADTVKAGFGKLDILINNAGVMLDRADLNVSEQPLDIWRKTFNVNLFGLIATTHAFLPLLRQSDSGRIVNVSSILGSNTLHSDPTSPIYDHKIPAYNVSKSAVNAWTVHLAYELRNTNIKVNAVHPGWVKTELGGDGAEMEIPDGAKTSVALALIPADGPNGGYFHMNDPLPW